MTDSNLTRALRFVAIMVAAFAPLFCGSILDTVGRHSLSTSTSYITWGFLLSAASIILGVLIAIPFFRLHETRPAATAPTSRNENDRLPEIEVILRRPTAGERIKVATSYGKRTKMGGDPLWIQADETPRCPSCGQAMSFVCQIDSFDYGDSLHTDYLFQDMIYVFYCFNCELSHSLVQVD